MRSSRPLERGFEALVAVLDPDVVLRADFGADIPARGSAAPRPWPPRRDVSRLGLDVPPALINGAVGLV